MLRINPVPVQGIKTENQQQADKPSFSGNPAAESEVKSLQNVYKDFSLRKPMSYTKNGQLSLPYNTTAHMYKLANGQKVVIIPKDGAKTYVKTYVNTGSMNEFDNIRGISHYIEHNLFNGSDGLEAGEFFATTDKMGAVTNASTAFAETNYFIGSHLLKDGDLEKKIKIHASMIETPRFAADMLEKEKGIVNSEINMITSYPENISANRTLMNLFGYKTASPDLIAGSTKNITNLTKKDVEDYFNRNYYPANMVTVVTGEVDPDETMKLISKYFTSTKGVSQAQYNEPVLELQKTVREDIISNKAVSASVTMGFAGPENNNTKDRIFSKALITLMQHSKDLNKDLKPLNTSLYASSEKMGTKPSAKRAIILNSDMAEESSEKFIKAVYKEINKRSNFMPTPDEMNMVKKKMLNDFSSSFEYSSAINDMTGKAILEDNLASLTDYEKIVKEMTPQDFVNTARKYFDLNKTAITVVHPDSATAESIADNHKAVAFTGSEKISGVSKEDVTSAQNSETAAKDKSVSFAGLRHKTALNMNDVSEYRMPNNFRVVTLNTPTRNSTFVMSFKVENPIKPENPAAAFVLNELLNQGSIFRNEEKFTEDMDKDDIDLQFALGENYIVALGSSDCDDISKSLISAKEVLYNPRFTQDVLDEVKEYIRDDIERAEKTPHQKLNETLYKGHLAGITNEEILENLDKVTLDDVKNLYCRIMSQAKASLVVAAPLRQNALITNDIFREAAQCPAVKDFNMKLYDDYKPVESSEVVTDTHNRNQADILMAYKFKVSGNLKDTACIELLNNILGGGPSSRLFNDLREKQHLAYSVRSMLDNSHNSEAIILSIGTTTENTDTGEISYDNVEKSIEGFKKHVNKLKTEKVSEEELESAKLSLKDSLLSQNQSGAGKCDNLSYSHDTPYGLSRENQLLDLIDTITVEDIYNTANYIFGGKPVYSIVATENTLKNNENYLKTLTT